MGTNVSTNFITCPADANKTLGIKLPFLVMIIKNVSDPSSDWLCSWKSTSLSRCRCWTTRTWGGDSEPQTTKARPEWSPSFAPCPWGWTRVGIRFNSTWVTSLGEPTEPTTSKRLGKYYRSETHLGFKSTQTAGSGEFTSLTDSTLKTNYLLNSNSSSQLLAKPMLNNFDNIFYLFNFNIIKMTSH